MYIKVTWSVSTHLSALRHCLQYLKEMFTYILTAHREGVSYIYVLRFNFTHVILRLLSGGTLGRLETTKYVTIITINILILILGQRRGVAFACNRDSSWVRFP